MKDAVEVGKTILIVLLTGAACYYYAMTRLSNDMMKYYDQVIHEKDSIILINYKK